MGTALDDLAMVDHQDLVGAADRAQAMRDHEARPPAHQAQQGELCATLLREDVAVFQERSEPLIGDQESGASPLARLDILITERVRMTETHLPLFVAIEESGGPGRGKPFRGPFSIWTHAYIRRLIGEAVERGEVTPLDLELTADVIQAAESPALYSYQRHECGYSSGVLGTSLAPPRAG